MRTCIYLLKVKLENGASYLVRRSVTELTTLRASCRVKGSSRSANDLARIT